MVTCSEIARPVRPKIRIIIAYFGPLPNYFELTYRSMGLNPDVNFLFLTDQPVMNRYPNVDVVSTSFETLADQVQQIYDFPISLPRPYKLCDFRPAFGELFAAELDGYDFWGHADLDVIFGQILDCIPEIAFRTYDKILVRGCLAFYRNSEDSNRWYRHRLPSADYVECFSDPASRHFDEWNGIKRILDSKGVLIWNEDVVFDMNTRRYRLRANAFPTDLGAYEWNNGEVIRTAGSLKSTAALIHLQKRPMQLRADLLAATRYRILADGFEAIDVRTVIISRLFRDLKSASRFHYARVRRRLR